MQLIHCATISHYTVIFIRSIYVHCSAVNAHGVSYQWRRGRGRGQLPWHPLVTPSLSENFLLGKFCAKIQNLGLKILHLGEFRGKIELLSTHDLLCRKFAVVCRKIATSCTQLL